MNWQTVVAPKLVERMKDREDHVLLEIVHALKEMTVQVNKFLPERGSQNVRICSISPFYLFFRLTVLEMLLV